MKLLALALLLTGCASASATARGVFATTYACSGDQVTTHQLPSPLDGSGHEDVEVRGCGHDVNYECSGGNCTDNSYVATDGTKHGIAVDAVVASAAHDLACDAKSVVKVSDRLFEGCGQRVSYRLVSDGMAYKYVLTARVAVEK